MEKWEYMTTLICANQTAKTTQYIHDRWPTWKPDKYSPEHMIPELNKWGEDGWELVTMEPVSIGHNSDVLTHFGPNTSYTPWYFCAFKRKIEG